MLKFGNENSEQKYMLSLSSGICREKRRTTLGLITRDYDVLTFKDKGSTITFQVDNKNCDIHLEILEIHQGLKNTFGYSVSVDEKTVYFRAYTDFFSSPQTHFVKINKKHLKNKQCSIRIQREGNYLFSLASVNVYYDFYRLAEEKNTYRKMGVNLFCPYYTPPENMLKIYPSYQSFETGIVIGMTFVDKTPVNLKELVTRFLDTADQLSIRTQLMPARWWGFTAFSPDGLGGYFSDVKYNQVVYDKVEKCYKLSTPNFWSSTLWPTMNSSHFERVAGEKLEVISSLIAKKDAMNRLGHKNTQTPRLVLEWGSGYWVNNRIDGGDFSEMVMAAAKKDGITLTPETGLTEEQIVWMFKNVAEYNKNLAAHCIDSVGNGITVIQDGEMQHPKTQFFDSIYSHTIQSEMYPTNSDYIPGWSSGVTENMWPSSEMYEFTNRCHYDYSLSYGKLSCVNLEITMLKKDSFKRYFKTAYEYGFEYITMFNPNLKNEPELLRQLDHMDHKPCRKPQEHFELFNDLNFLRDYDYFQFSNSSSLIKEYQNVGISTEGNLVLAENSASGYLTFMISDKTLFSNGLRLYMEGYTKQNAKIELFAGETLNSICKAYDFKMGKKLNWFNRHSTFHAVFDEAAGKETYYVMLKLTGDCKNVSIRAIRFEAGWKYKQGYLHDKQATVREKRLESLWLQDKAVAERYLSLYRQKTGKLHAAAERLIEEYRFSEAVLLLSKEISQLLPARYLLQGTGVLGSYPIEAYSKNPVLITLLRMNENEVEFTAEAVEEKAAVQFEIKINNGNKYLLEKNQNIFLLKKHTEGKSTFKLDIPREPEKRISGSVTAIALHIGDNEIRVECQEPSIGEYASEICFKLSENCIFKRKKETDENCFNEKPSEQDKVTLVFNENGEVCNVLAEYGIAEGKVVHYKKPTLFGDISNGVITLDNGEQYEFYHNHRHTIVTIGGKSGPFKNLTLKEMENLIKPGMTLKISYTPYTYKSCNKRMLTCAEI